MKDRRYNWKANLTKVGQDRKQKQKELHLELEMICIAISQSKTIAEYDELKEQQREIIAQLATL